MEDLNAMKQRMESLMLELFNVDFDLYELARNLRVDMGEMNKMRIACINARIRTQNAFDHEFALVEGSLKAVEP